MQWWCSSSAIQSGQKWHFFVSAGSPQKSCWLSWWRQWLWWCYYDDDEVEHDKYNNDGVEHDWRVNGDAHYQENEELEPKIFFSPFLSLQHLTHWILDCYPLHLKFWGRSIIIILKDLTPRFMEMPSAAGGGADLLVILCLSLWVQDNDPSSSR